MDFIIRHFAIRGWKQVLYAFIFILLCWQLSRFWGNWKDGVSSIFYVIHAPIHEVLKSLHQPHQSLPVLRMKMALFFVRASANA